MYHHERSARPLTPRQLECGTMVWVDERLDFQYRAILVHHLIVAPTEGNIDDPTGPPSVPIRAGEDPTDRGDLR